LTNAPQDVDRPERDRPASFQKGNFFLAYGNVLLLEQIVLKHTRDGLKRGT
jgi:hypothetical protein